MFVIKHVEKKTALVDSEEKRYLLEHADKVFDLAYTYMLF
jgi:hypothetical protein